MILSKDSNNNWTPTAGGTGTFIGTKAAFDAVKATLPDNTVAYITDDGNGDLQPVDAVTNGDMHPVTSNAVYDALVPVDITSDITFDTSKFTVFASETKVWKVGRLVVCLLKGQLLSNAGYNTIGNGFPQPVSSNNVANFTFVTNDGSTGTKSGCGYINNSRNICVRFCDGTGEFAANFSYIARE